MENKNAAGERKTCPVIACRVSMATVITWGRPIVHAVEILRSTPEETTS